MGILSAILKGLTSALPGLLAIIKAFSKKDEEPTQADIAGKAKSEIEELEKWKDSTRQ